MIRLHLALSSLIVALTCLTYASVWHADFAFQDWRWQAAASQPDVKTSLVAKTWRLQERFIPSPTAFHVFNVLMHLMVTFVVWVWLRGLGCSIVASYVGVAAFVLNPVAVESVAYVSGRAELLAAFGVMVACAAVAFAVNAQTLSFVALGSVFAVTAKDSALIVIVLASFIALVQHTRRHAVVVLTLFLVIGACVWAWRVDRVIEWVSTWPDPHGWFLAQSAAAYRLLGMSVLPVIDQTPTFDHEGLTQVQRIASVGGLISLSVFAFFIRKDIPLLATACVWMLLVILPRLVVPTPESYMTEHQFYLALPGVSLAFAAMWDRSAA